MKYFNYIAIVLFLSLLGCNEKQLLTQEEENWLEQNPDLTVAIFPYYSPYQFINDRKVAQGIFIDYLKLLETKIDYTFIKKQYDDWPMVLDDAQHDQIDIILEAQQTKERSEFLIFSDILFESEFVIVTSKNANYGSDIESLYNRTVVLPTGYSIEDIMRGHTAKIKFYNKANDTECLKSVNAGEFDAFVGPKAVVNFIINANKLNNLKIAGSIEDTYHPSIAIRKNNPMLSSIINKAIASVSFNEKERLMRNWLYDYEKPFYQKIWFWIYAILILGGLITLYMYFNFHLKKVIEKRKLELKASKHNLNNDTALKIEFIEKASKSYKDPFENISSITDQLENTSLQDSKNLVDEIIKNADALVDNLDKHLKIRTVADDEEKRRNKKSILKKSTLDVLLVDDVAINVLILEKLLNEIPYFNFTFHKANNGRVAVDLCKNHKELDLVFMDIRMPVMDGYEASKTIRDLFPELPIIAQTAFVSAQDRQRAFDAGCGAYITKPIITNDLKDAIGKFYEPED